MAYVNVPNDLSRIKTKLAFNLTKRQLVCFGTAAVIGIPTYLLARLIHRRHRGHAPDDRPDTAFLLPGYV